MKHLLIVIVIALFSGMTPSLLFAETSVDISNNGEGASSEVHVESSGGESTVCINGKCETTQGNVDIQENGVKVRVENVGSQASDSGNENDPSTSAERQSRIEELMNTIRQLLNEMFRE